MKMVGIDVDALTSQAAVLREQLADVEAVLRIVSGSATPEQPKLAPRAPDREVAAAVSPRAERSYVNVGARKAVTLALHTGPSSIRDMGRALVWDQPKVKEVLSSMLLAKLATMSEGGLVALTDAGQQVARWHIAHPQYMTYCPGRTAR